jgi:hypothetical protein
VSAGTFQEETMPAVNLNPVNLNRVIRRGAKGNFWS